MSSTRQVQEPKDRFNELLETSLADSPQMTRPDLKELLLAPETRTDTLTRRAVTSFDERRLGPTSSRVPSR